MPAAARQQHHSPALDEHHASPPSAPNRRRLHPSRTTVTEEEWDDLQPLVQHFLVEHPSTDPSRAKHHYKFEEEHILEARAARRRPRITHRPLRLSRMTLVVSSLLLGQLVALLWLGGAALSARNRSLKLNDQIEQMRLEIGLTQKKISALDSSPHIKRWAQERGWVLATQKDIDDLTKATAVASTATADDQEQDTASEDPAQPPAEIAEEDAEDVTIEPDETVTDEARIDTVEMEKAGGTE